MLIACLVMWTYLAGAATNTSCSSGPGIAENAITPQAVTEYLSQNPKINDPEKFLCCLPKSIRGSFVVMHNSDAGQSGNPHGPRVLMFPPGTNEIDAPRA